MSFLFTTVVMVVENAMCKCVIIRLIYRVFTGCGCTWHSRFILMHMFFTCTWPFLQLIGLVDYKSLKKVHLSCTSFRRTRQMDDAYRPLKLLMDWASTSSCDILFHLLMTRCENSATVCHKRLCFFTNFQLCPLVEVFSAFLKNVTKEWMKIPLSFWITRSSQLHSFFPPGTITPTDVTTPVGVMVPGGKKKWSWDEETSV